MGKSRSTKPPIGTRVRHISDSRLDGVIEAYNRGRTFVRATDGVGYWFDRFPFLTADAENIAETGSVKSGEDYADAIVDSITATAGLRYESRRKIRADWPIS